MTADKDHISADYNVRNDKNGGKNQTFRKMYKHIYTLFFTTIQKCI